MAQLFDKSGGYRKLYSFTYATLIQLGTIRFCRRFVSFRDDPLGKTSGQMVGAARSGRQNVIEASERAATSKETEIELTDVARASLAELLGDYEIHLAEKGCIPWGKDEPDRRDLGALWLPPFEFGDDSLHDYWLSYHEVRKPSARWLDSDDGTVVANAMIVLIAKTMAMLGGQLEHQGHAFLDQGGFRERMHQCRSAAREEAAGDAGAVGPLCPDCGRPMRQRIPRTGERAGRPFWGCTGYPACKGTREIQHGNQGQCDPVTP
jgi:four helix bundle suffix protein